VLHISSRIILTIPNADQIRSFKNQVLDHFQLHAKKIDGQGPPMDCENVDHEGSQEPYKAMWTVLCEISCG